MSKFYLKKREMVTYEKSRILIWDVKAENWEEAKKVAFLDMNEGDVLVECSSDFDEKSCVKRATLKQLTRARALDEPDFIVEPVFYFSDDKETLLDAGGKELKNPLTLEKY